jgi:hypothetical protein
VSIRRGLREGEVVVVSVTPVPRGLAGPVIVTAVVIGAVVAAAALWTWPHEHVRWLSLLVIPPAVVLGGRLARWRSHKIVVTNQRIIEVGGVLTRHRGSFELHNVHTTHFEQRLTDRFARRGIVVLQTETTTVVLERVRHPDALVRVIDHQRHLLDRTSATQLDRADELSDALDAGLLSDDDYDERWWHLFGRGHPRH